MLCLPRAGPPFGAIHSGDIGLLRGSSAPVHGQRAASRGKTTINVDISSLLKSCDSNESQGYALPPPRDHILAHSNHPLPTHGQPLRTPNLTPPATAQLPPSRPVVPMSVPGSRRSMPSQGPSDQPVKKQSKWSPEEDALIIELRGSGMKWEDVSKRLPGRSAISCRLHYQNYLERRSEWDEERKNKLARLYER